MMQRLHNIRARAMKRGDLMVVLTDQTLTSFGNLVGIGLIARFIGLEAFGLFSLVWILVNLAQVLVYAAVIAPMIAAQVRLPAHRMAALDRCAIELTLGLAGIFCALFLSVTLAIRWIWEAPAIWDGDLWVCGVIAAMTTSEFFRRRALAKKRPQQALLQDVARFGVIFGALGLAAADLLVIRDEVDGFILLFASGVVSTLAGGALAGLGRADFRLRRYLAARHMRSSRSMLGEQLLAFGANNLQFFLATAMLGPAALAGLRAALQIARTASLVTQAIENWLPPQLGAVLRGGTLDRLWQNTLKTCGVLFGVQVCIFGVIVLFGPWLMTLIYGPQFAQYTHFIVIFAAYQMFVGVAVAPRAYFVVRGRGDVLLRLRKISSVLTLCAMYPLLLIFGAEGAALTSFTSGTGFFILVFSAFLLARSDDGGRPPGTARPDKTKKGIA